MTDFTMSMYRSQDDMVTAMREHIATLEAQFESVGAGGVERLRSGGWRELCRRLYVELFHCDQQMTQTRDEDGDPIWQQGSTVRNVLADAKAALSAEALPTPKAEPAPIVGCHECYITHDLGACATAQPAVEPVASLAAQRDALLQVALDFIGTLTGMSPPPIEIAPPEVFAPFYAFVDRVQAITSPAPAPNALDALTQAARDVLDERQRQIDAKGYEPEADDAYEQGELASAAATYALLATGADGWRVDDHWPWAMHSLKKGDPRRMLVKSAALNLAEIERIDRAALAAQSAQGAKP